MVVFLELSRDECDALGRALDVRLLELRRELVSTDDRSYRQSLRGELELLEGIDTRMKGPKAA